MFLSDRLYHTLDTVLQQLLVPSVETRIRAFYLIIHNCKRQPKSSIAILGSFIGDFPYYLVDLDRNQRRSADSDAAVITSRSKLCPSRPLVLWFLDGIASGD